VIALSSAVVPLAAPPPSLLSAWRTAAFAPDGADGEWAGAATPLTGAPVAVGVMNDDEFLYLRVRALDRGAQMQVLFGGLTVWFDPKGGDRKAFGIRYPVGSPLPAPRTRGGGPGRRPGSGPVEPPEGSGRSEPASQPADRGGQSNVRGGPVVPADLSEIVPRRLEVLGPGDDDARSLVLDHANGITVALGRSEGALIYELRVPLKPTTDRPYAIGTASGALVGVGFDSPKMKRERPPEGEPGSARGGSPPGGGPGGGGGGMGRMGRGMPMGMGRGGPGDGPNPLPESAKPWKTWIKVQLAQPAAASPGAQR
jgi:hypothetical protein